MEPAMILLHYHLYYYIKLHLASRKVEFAAVAAAAAATIICRMAVRRLITRKKFYILG